MVSKAEAAASAAAYPQLPSDGNQLPPTYAQATNPIPQPGFQGIPLQHGALPVQHIQNTVIVQTPVGPRETRTTCPSCQAVITTRISHDTSTRTHLFALLCCLIFFPCACVPYCMDSCKDTNHYCPNCNAYLGTYRDRM